MATYLRRIRDKLPIYILTSYADERDEFVDGEWDVDSIISKEEMGDQGRRRVYITRLLRQLDRYETLREAREERFHDLVKKTLSEGLSEAEQQEFEELDLWRVSAIMASETVRSTELDEVVDEIFEVVKELKSHLPDKTQDQDN